MGRSKRTLFVIGCGLLGVALFVRLYVYIAEPAVGRGERGSVPTGENASVTLPNASVYSEGVGGENAVADFSWGEAVWRVESTESEAHLARAVEAGLCLKQRIERLGLVLVEGPLELLRAWQDPDLAAGINVPLTLLPRPSAKQLASGAPLRDQLLAFLGLDNRPEEWGTGVRIAILDTGISQHPALDGSKVTLMQRAERGTGVDTHGHGTAVAGLIAGNDSVAIGLAPSASLLVYQVLDGDGVGDAFGIASAIIAAVDAGAQIISLSAGSTTGAMVLGEAVAYATERDVVIVAASGNDGAARALFPAAYPEVLAVGAVDRFGRPASFSNADPHLDLVAPGVGLYTAYSDGRYVEFSGTSAATPLVAGALAALMSEEPTLSARQATEALLSYADDAGGAGVDTQTGAGIMNPSRVLARNDPNLSDLGVSAPYLNPALSTETMATISLNVQNRGNQYIPRGQAEVTVDGQMLIFPLAGLEAGASVPIVVEVPADALRGERGILFEVEVETGAGQLDDKPSNDGYALVLQLNSDE